jgi:cation transport ATPase
MAIIKAATAAEQSRPAPDHDRHARSHRHACLRPRKQEERNVKSTTKIWLWLSVILAVGGAVMLYPIGPAAANAIFVLIKIGMVAGLLVLLFSGNKKGFALWAACSAGAIVMTLIKWTGGGSAVFLYVVSIIVDAAMPLGAWKLMRAHK